MYVKVLLSTAVVLVAIRGGRTEDFANCPRWTDWYDDDDPGGAGDYETLAALRANHPGEICAKPTAIHAETVPDSTFYALTGDDIFAVNVVNGLICRNVDQAGEGRTCRDYRVRFCCPESGDQCPRWTDWIDKDDPDPDIECAVDDDVCDDPTAMEARVVGTHVPASATGEIFHVFHCDVGLVCRGVDQGGGQCEDYEVRFCCPEEEDPNPPQPRCRIRIIIVFDVSSSMSLLEFLRLLWFLIDFILCFNDVDVEIGLITYECLPRLDIPLGTYPSGDLRFIAAIEGLERRGGRTRTGLALHYVKCMTDFPEDAWSVVVLVSDGTEANGQGTNDYVAQAAMLRDSGIEMYAVAVGYPFLVNTAALATITGNPDRVVSPTNTNACELANRITEECCGEN